MPRPNNNGHWSYLNLRLRPEVRDAMKTTAKSKGMTVQALFAAFCESYITDPDIFRIILAIKQHEVPPEVQENP